MSTIFNIRLITRGDLESNWITNDPVLNKGEMAITYDENDEIVGVKIGIDNNWSETEYWDKKIIGRWFESSENVLFLYDTETDTYKFEIEYPTDDQLETQTTPNVEDNKIISRRGLLYWWNWLKGDVINFKNTTDSDSTNNGSVVIDGGLGVQKNLTTKSLKVSDLIGTGIRSLVTNENGLITISSPIITNTTIISQITNNSNWSTSNIYSGPSISGASQNQYYRDTNYFYYFYNNVTPIRIPLNIVLSEASNAETLAGTVSDKYISPLRWAYIKSQIQNITNRWQFLGIGVGTSGVSSAFLTTAASTSAVASFLINFGSTFLGATNGSIWGELTNWRMRILRNSIPSDFLFSYDNFLYKGVGTRVLTSNQAGDISAVVDIQEGFVLDSELILSITSAT
jgi:hypothetical protein